MGLQDELDKLFTNPGAKEMVSVVTNFAKECETFLEFGCRGGVSGMIFMKALLQSEAKWRPRYVGVDLVEDQTIDKLKELAEQNRISFEFWKGHSKSYPIHETDGFCWDTFHCGGALFEDLTKIAPHVKKRIFILGTGIFGSESEAIVRKLDISQVAKELQITEDGVKMGMKEGIRRFLSTNHDWEEIGSIGEITILKRAGTFSNSLFKA
jgi:hypothetical protein